MASESERKLTRLMGRGIESALPIVKTEMSIFLSKDFLRDENVFGKITHL